MDTFRHVRVALGEAEFNAVDPSGARWNGFVACPFFDRDEAERVVAHVNAQYVTGAADGERLYWAGDDIVCVDVESGVETRSPYTPALGWAIGSYGWCWFEVGAWL